MKRLAIAGYGGFAREVEWLVGRINAVSPTWDFIGFIDNKDSDDHRIIGDDEFIINQNEELYVAIAIGFSDIRQKIYKAYKANPNIKFANLIDPSVICSDRIVIGEGNIICAGSILTVDITIENCVIINLDCTVGHNAVLEDYVTINPSVNISGDTKIGTGSNIGTGTQTIQGISIGKNCIVGAGSVVNRDLPDNCTAVGVPAKVIKTDERDLGYPK